jgi:iron(III) transport system permease protein
MRLKQIPPAKNITVTAFLLITVLPILILLIQWIVTIISGNTEALRWAIPSGKYLQVLGNSLALALAVALFSTLIGTGLALWLNGGSTFKKFVGAVYLMPLLIAPYIHCLEWVSIFGNRQFLARILSALPGLKDINFSSYGFAPAMFVLTSALFPIVTLLVRRGLGAIQIEFIEVALLSHTPWNVFRRIVLPLLLPSIIASVGIIFVLVLVEYGVPSLLQYNVYISEVYSSFSLYFDPVRAFATGLPIIILAGCLLASSQLMLKNSPLQSGKQDVTFFIDQWPFYVRALLSLSLIFWIFASTVPVIVLFIRGSNPALFMDTLTNNTSEITRSIIVAGTAATIATMISIPLASSLSRGMSRPWWFIFVLPLAIPAPLTGIGMIFIWNRPVLEWVYDSWLILVLVQAARFLPFALFTASSGVRNIDPTLIEASRLPDVGFFHRMKKVILPLLTPTIAMTWLISFVFAQGEIGASLLVAPPGQSTLPITIYNLMHYGATDTVSVMSLIILLTAGLACFFLLVVYKQMLRNKA